MKITKDIQLLIKKIGPCLMVCIQYGKEFRVSQRIGKRLIEVHIRDASPAFKAFMKNKRESL